MPPSDDSPDWVIGWLFGLPALLVVLELAPLSFPGVGIPLTIPLILGCGILGDMVIIGVAWLFLCRRQGRAISSLGLRLPPRRADLLLRPIEGAVLAIFGLFLASAVYAVLAGGRELPEQESLKVLETIRGPWLKVLALAALGCAAPLAEEIAFRGVAFRGLSWRIGRFPALFFSAGIFSIAHLDPGHALHLFVVGLVLAWLVDRSGSIYPSIILHSGINITAYLVG